MNDLNRPVNGDSTISVRPFIVFILVAVIALLALFLSAGVQPLSTAVNRQPFTISGQVRFLDGDPADGVNIVLSQGAITTTEANGFYTFTNLLAGTYILTPSLSSYIFHPPTRTVTLPPSAIDQDFVILSGTVSFLPLVTRDYGAVNHLPNIPSTPVPADGATDLDIDIQLSWTGGDPDGDSVTYDVYLGANDTTPNVLVSDDQLGTVYDPGVLSGEIHYYWQIVATDEHDATTTGPVWDFSTAENPSCSLNAQEQQIADKMIQDPEQARPTLTCHPTLAQVARERANDMAQRGYCSSTDPDGFGANYWVREAGYLLPSNYGTAPDANNVMVTACGYTTADAVWQNWMDSTAAREFLLGLKPAYTEQIEYGIGYVFDSGSTYRHYWVVITAEPGP